MSRLPHPALPQRVQVMISSTIEDLSAEREAADHAIRHFQFERFRSETMTSIPRSPREVCEAMARTCDVQVLLIGARYGWIIPELAISVTERECQFSRARDP
jgi:hypothetical protein